MSKATTKKPASEPGKAPRPTEKAKPVVRAQASTKINTPPAPAKPPISPFKMNLKTPVVKPTTTEATTRKAPPPAPPAPETPAEEKNEEAPLPKTYLDGEELDRFRELLLKKRAEICGDVRSLTDEALNRSGNTHGDQSTMPIHMADLGTDNWEQEFTLGLIANEQAVVREIDEALERVRSKTYGMCLATHKRITKARLRAKPWAKYCIEYERAREEGRVL